MALNQFMHPRNRYKDNKPDFNKLAEKYPEFAKHVSIGLTGNASLDFHDPEALRALTCTLLKDDFDLDVEVPLDRLIPTIPLRLNYIHWIEDLLQQNGCTGDVYGIDIGCGASCIYPLLGCQMNGWHFAASEIDELGYQYACDNVKRNNLQDLIKVVPSPKDTIIQGVFKSVPQSTYHFTMCNPPFFGNIMEAQGIMSRTMDRPEPKSVSTASEVEMIYEEGGEVDFVKRMIMESLQLREQIMWYTSMLGKKSSVGILKAELMKHKIRNFTTTEFCQGRTMRWGIAWTFYEDIKILPPSKRKKTKQRPPLVIPVPDRFVTNSVANSSSSSVGKREKVMAVAEATKQMLTNLNISFAIQSSSRKVVSLECTAFANTWANQRRKRRQRQRQKTGTQDMSLAETNIVDGASVGDEVIATCAKTNMESSCAYSRDVETDITRASTNIKSSSSRELQTKLTTASKETNMEFKLSRRPESYNDKCDSTLSTRKNHDLETRNKSDADQKCKLNSNIDGNLKCDSEHDQISDVQKDGICTKSSTLESDQTVADPKVSILPDSSKKGPQINLNEKASLLKIQSNDQLIASVLQDLSAKEPSPVKSQMDLNTGELLLEGKDNNNKPKTTEKDSTNDQQQKCTKSHADLNEGIHNTSNVDSSTNGTGAKGQNSTDGEGQNSTEVKDQNCTGVKGQNCTNSQMNSNEGTQGKDTVEPLFKCSLLVKLDDDDMIIEMSFLDGSSKEAMHQVGQYIKNQLAKR